MGAETFRKGNLRVQVRDHYSLARPRHHSWAARGLMTDSEHARRKKRQGPTGAAIPSWFQLLRMGPSTKA